MVSSNESLVDFRIRDELSFLSVYLFSFIQSEHANCHFHLVKADCRGEMRSHCDSLQKQGSSDQRNRTYIPGKI